MATADAPVRVPTPPLPPDAIPLRNQVSGHFYGQKETKLGMLELKNGTLLKPLIPPKGDKELVFYRKVFQSPGSITSDIQCLRPLLPQFYGLWATPLHPNVKYLILENLTVKFSKPCIMDVKVGPRTWGPTATEDKKTREMAKYPPQMHVGFRLLGVKVYKPSTDRYFKIDHLAMRTLQAEDILPKGILVYLNHEENVSYKQNIIKAFITKLKQVLDWFRGQTTFHFYASSLLFLYEGRPRDGYTNGIDRDRPSMPDPGHFNDFVDIRLIDFTHVFPAEGQRDENYTTGVSKLLMQFEAALEICSQEN